MADILAYMTSSEPGNNTFGFEKVYVYFIRVEKLANCCPIIITTDTLAKTIMGITQFKENKIVDKDTVQPPFAKY